VRSSLLSLPNIIAEILILILHACLCAVGVVFTTIKSVKTLGGVDKVFGQIGAVSRAS
jgi:hypothetical protein